MSRWEAPSSPWLKVNTDATFSKLINGIDLGMVIRGSMRKVILSALYKMERTETILHAEMMAIRLGIQLATDRSYDCLVIESDSILAISLIERGIHVGGWEFSFDILDMAIRCEICKLKHFNKEANSLAHQITKTNGRVGHLEIWDGSLPVNEITKNKSS